MLMNSHHPLIYNLEEGYSADNQATRSTKTESYAH